MSKVRNRSLAGRFEILAKAFFRVHTRYLPVLSPLTHTRDGYKKERQSSRGWLCVGGVHLNSERLLGEGVLTPQAQVPCPMGGGQDPPTARAFPWGGPAPPVWCAAPRPHPPDPLRGHSCRSSEITPGHDDRPWSGLVCPLLTAFTRSPTWPRRARSFLGPFLHLST